MSSTRLANARHYGTAKCFALIIMSFYSFFKTWQWFKVGSNDTLVNITAGPQLIITSTSLSDAGEYVCQANNHRGDAEERIQINIEPGA